MKALFNPNLIALARALDTPIYAVGGVVRNFLIDKSISLDVDLAGDLLPEQVGFVAVKFGFKVVCEYKKTGTLVFTDGKRRYEFTSFRTEKYHGGEHCPYEVTRTSSIKEDALRRDFKCNAIYYDLKNGEFVDVLKGMADVENRVIDTVASPSEVFSHDGLRLMRLARFCAELNFTPTSEVLEGARKNCGNIKDISPERIFAELRLILKADKKYAFSNPNGHYVALKILDETRVLDGIIPELTAGRGMTQRADYHKYDVLEHTLKAVQYAHPKVRLSALFHDIAKPYCKSTFGEFYRHDLEGVEIAKKVLKRLKVDTKTERDVVFAVRYHMIDMDCKMREVKVRRFIVKNYDRLDGLFMIKQADFTASMEDKGVAPTIEKWERIIKKMKEEGVPFSLKQIIITAEDLKNFGYKGIEIGEKLEKLWEHLIINPKDNDRETLLRMIKRDKKQ
ncbi:MAG: CCA tRNA nucleotidyltransferase [Clostridia bacterium]|nr:CCA tRNA nucleotidyltransferase [Clostridia bacterium]